MRDRQLEGLATWSGFPLRFRCRHSLLGRPIPAKGSALLTVGPPAQGPDPDGVTAFRTHELRPGWVPPVPEDGGAHPRLRRVLSRRLPLHYGKSLNPATTSHHARLRFTRHQTGIHLVHPSGLPLAHAPGMEPATLRLPPELRTPPLPAAHARGGDRPSSTDLELLAHIRLILQSGSSLVSCDFASHRAERVPAQRRFE